MTAYAQDLWRRAVKALSVARATLSMDPDAAASRAYYAAFYAVSAMFALEEKWFKRHMAVESAVHRDLVQAGKWPPEVGQAYSRLLERRATGDYGVEKHVSAESASDSIAWAERMLRLVATGSGGVLRYEGV